MGELSVTSQPKNSHQLPLSLGDKATRLWADVGWMFGALFFSLPTLFEARR